MILPVKKEKNGLLKKHLEVEEKILTLFTKKEIDIKELLECVNELNELNELRNDKKFEIQESFLVEDKKLDEKLIKSYKEAKNELRNTYRLLEKDEIPVLNLDKVKEFLEDINEDFEIEDDLKLEDIDINHKIVVLSNSNEKKQLIFKNGKKIILTKKLFDLSVFTHDELVEILQFLDLIITDDSYDYLRSEITKQITNISSISKI